MATIRRRIEMAADPLKSDWGPKAKTYASWLSE